MKSSLTTLKGKILLAGIGVLVIAAVIVGVVFLISKEEGYRSVAVKQLEGTTIIKSEQNEQEAYEGMHLNSGDDIKVQNESNLTLLMDADKYLYAQAGTHFEVECVDGEKSGKKVIHLKDGSVLIRLKTALKDGEIYEVETPNGTMSVRGTVFRISVDKDANDLVHTGIEVFDGKVQVDLRPENGEYNGVGETFEVGEAGAIVGNTEFAEFVTGEDGTNTWEIDYKELPQDVAKVLVDYIDDGEELSIEKELLMDYADLEEHKMETRVGMEATCTKDGLSQQSCTICNKVMNSTNSKALGHTFGVWDVRNEATCTIGGTQVRTCARCGQEETGSIAALGHSYGNWSEQTKATCTQTGIEVRNCSICGETERREIAALGHILSGNHEHQNLVRDGSDYVACDCISYCTREGCGEEVSVSASVRNSVLGVMVQYFCNNCGEQI